MVESPAGSRLIGIDEVGRGALAGPVVAAAVAQPAGPKLSWWRRVNDSKKLKKKVITELSAKLTATVQYGVGEASAQEIDMLGITRATALAMDRALAQLKREHPTVARWPVVVDGNSKLGHPGWTPVIRGDSKVWAVAAASIIAKAARDSMMQHLLASRFPQYLWGRNKGYGTRAHMSALRKYGPCEEHRMTFRGVK
jgi:ribonuclease HII